MHMEYANHEGDKVYSYAKETFMMVSVFIMTQMYTPKGTPWKCTPFWGVFCFKSMAYTIWTHVHLEKGNKLKNEIQKTSI